MATVGVGERHPHLVPVCFALEGDLLYTAIDHKPKRTGRLRRIENILANPYVSLLADHYDEDWTRLWWVRADGEARVLEPTEAAHTDAAAKLEFRYRQYCRRPPAGPAIVVRVSRWVGWSASG